MNYFGVVDTLVTGSQRIRTEKSQRIGTEWSARAGGGDWNAVISHSVTVTLSVTHWSYTLSMTHCYTKCVWLSDTHQVCNTRWCADTSDNIGAFRVTDLTITSLWPLTKIDLISHHRQLNTIVHFKRLRFVQTVKLESKIAKCVLFSQYFRQMDHLGL